MGVTEEGGKVASGVVDALRGQPALLVLVLVSIMLWLLAIASLWWSASAASQQDKLFAELARECLAIKMPKRESEE